MKIADNNSWIPYQSLPVYLSNAFFVTDGVNVGEPISNADELVLDDDYTFVEHAKQQHLTIAQPTSPANDAQFIIMQGSEVGKMGNHLHLDCVITLMGTDGCSFGAIILVEVDPDENVIDEIYLLALTPFNPKGLYRLVGVTRKAIRTRLAEIAYVPSVYTQTLVLVSEPREPVTSLKVSLQT